MSFQDYIEIINSYMQKADMLKKYGLKYPTHTPKNKIKSSLGGKMCYQTFSVKTIIHTVYWPNNNEVLKFVWSTYENISQSQWQQQQQQQRAEISSQPDVNKETTSKSAQNIKQSASTAASASAFKTPVAMPRAQKLTEENRCDITNSHFAY